MTLLEGLIYNGLLVVIYSVFSPLDWGDECNNEIVSICSYILVFMAYAVVFSSVPYIGVFF